MATEFVDTKYVLQLMAGDESAFALVYNLYAQKVYRLAFKFLRNQTYSEEIVQETFIKLWLTKGKLDPSGNIWLYLFVIAKRLSINSLREQNQSTIIFQKLVEQTSETQNFTEENILVRDLEAFTERVLQKLPKQQHQVFIMSRKDGLTHKEIAEKLHISSNTVKNHIVAALKFLKTYLKYAEVIVLIFLNIFK